MRAENVTRSRSSEQVRIAVDRGELTIQRMAGAEPADAMDPWRSMLNAVEKHERDTLDQEAAFGTRPLSAAEAAGMMDRQSVVSGYRLLKLTEFCRTPEEALDAVMAAKLAEVELHQIAWEAVWALGDSVLVYIRGALRGA